MSILLNKTDRLEANDIDTDYKAETIATRLLNYGLTPEQVLFKRKGANKRGVSKDISVISVNQNRYDTIEESIEISTLRNGIYDSLPEGLFYKVGSSPKSRSKEQILEEIRKRREEEFFNRRFFQPFEEEVDRNLMMIQLKEVSFDKKNTDTEFVHIFNVYWPVIKNMNLRRAAIFIEIVPLIHRIRTNHKEIARAMTLVFELPVSIEAHQDIQHIEQNIQSTLGNIKLGENFTTSGHLNDRIENITIHIGPMPVKRFNSFNHKGSDAEMLTCLTDMLFPAHCRVSAKYSIIEEDAIFKLDKTDSNPNTFLGINTILK